jgi:hypothetical protein
MRYRSEPLLFALVCCVIIAGYSWVTYPAVAQYGLLEPSQQHFNQLLAGFKSGQLSLKEAPSPELAKLADPYDPVQNAPYRLHDASYYHGKFYIYFGVTPVLVLFWPFLALTGHYLSQKYAVVIFCSVGFLIGAALVWQIRRRYFAKIGTGVFLSLVLAVGTVNGAAFLVRRPEMYEVSISCAYAMVMAALWALWWALNSERRPLVWTALSSLFFGLAVAARPPFLFGAASLLIPVAYLTRFSPDFRTRKFGGLKLGFAAFAPLVSIGMGLAVYNYLRFGNPLEFGIKYMMSGNRVTNSFPFNWQCIWLNARLYLLLPTRLMAYFPFVRGVQVPPLPQGYAFVENPYGIITNIPFLLLACAAPLAWRQPRSEATRRLQLFACALAWVSLMSVAFLLVYVVATIRYELDFTPYLAILGVIGVFGVEDYHLAHPRGRGLARLGWVGLLIVSIAFNFFGSCQHLRIFERDAPDEFQGLSRFFDYPVYAYNRYLSPSRAAPAAGPPADDKLGPGRYGPFVERIEMSAVENGAREPLLVIGNVRENAVIVFIRSVTKDRVAVGLEFPGIGTAECLPIRRARGGPIDVAIFAPQLLPDLGDPDWGAAPYRKQLSDLGLYTITINGIAALQVRAPLSKPIDRDAPLSIGANPLDNTSVAGRFGGQIVVLPRLKIGESPRFR